MTEKEAMTKWCPYGNGFAPDADGTFSTPVSHCLGSKCMNWQPYESAAFKANAEYVYRAQGVRRTSDEGYCVRGGVPLDA